MKKFAIVGIVLAGLLLPTAIAQAKPTGMTKAEYRALMIRSEGLNQKYGLGEKSRQASLRSKLEEIGAWAVPSTQPVVGSKPLVSEKLAGLDLPTPPPTIVASGSDGFDWNDAGIGAAFVFGAVFLGAASLMTVRRHQQRPVVH